MSEKKKISKKEFEAALKDMNEWLVAEGKEEINTEGKTSDEQLHLFVVPIIEVLEAGKAENLPASVIDFYNNYLADDEEDSEEETEEKTEEETSEKEEKTKEKPKRRGRKRKENDPNALKPWQKPTGKEKLVYDMVKEGKSDQEIEKAIRDGYKDNPDEEFIAWRVYTYMTKGKNFLAKEDPAFAEKWEKAKKKIKPVVHPKKKKTPEEIAEIEKKKAEKKAEAEKKKAEKKAEADKKKAEKKKEKPAEKKKTTKPAEKKKTTKSTSSKKTSSKKG